MNCGTVVYDRNFQFANGKMIDKLYIVLCEFGTAHLVFTVTGQRHTKGDTPGCQSGDRFPSYFLPQGSCWFQKDTWVELHDINELDGAITDQKMSDGTMTEYANVLGNTLMKGIIDCALQSRHIDRYYLDYLKSYRQKMP